MSALPSRLSSDAKMEGLWPGAQLGLAVAHPLGDAAHGPRDPGEILQGRLALMRGPHFQHTGRHGASHGPVPTRAYPGTCHTRGLPRGAGRARKSRLRPTARTGRWSE